MVLPSGLSRWMALIDDSTLKSGLRSSCNGTERHRRLPAHAARGLTEDAYEHAPGLTEKSTLADSAADSSSEGDDNVTERCLLELNRSAPAFEDDEDIVEVAEEVPWCSVFCDYPTSPDPEIEPSYDLAGSETPSLWRVPRNGGKWSRAVGTVRSMLGWSLCRSHR